MASEVPVQNEMSAKAKTILCTILVCSIVALVFAAIVGMTRDCTTLAQTTYSSQKAAMYVDDGDAGHLAQKHPALSEVCKIAGSCDAVTATYWPKTLVNGGKDLWNIRVPGAIDESDSLYDLCGAGDTLDEAAKDFVDTYRRNRAAKAYAKGKP